MFSVVVLLLCVLNSSSAFFEASDRILLHQNTKESCGGLNKYKKHRNGVKMNYTLYGDKGDMSKRPVVIINTLSRGAREWDEFARLLCESKNFSIAVVHSPVIEKKVYWRIILTIKEARSELSSPDPVVVFAKRTGAVYAIKYALKIGCDNISRMGLVSPNITELGDVWTLNSFKGRLSLFWNIADRSVDYFISAIMWESSIMPPMITVRDTKRALSHQLFHSMHRFAEYGLIFQANYSTMYEDDKNDPATEDIVVYE
jgi:hypothetical protein